MNICPGDHHRPVVLRRPKDIRHIKLISASVSHGKLVLCILLKQFKGQRIAVIVAGSQHIIQAAFRVCLLTLLPNIAIQGNLIVILF